jgi:putative nucleotidyltransferase with HDIG domain
MARAFASATNPARTVTAAIPTVLLISDRDDQSRDLGSWIGRVCACRNIGLHDRADLAKDVAAVVTDVAFRNAASIARLRSVLTQYRLAATPIMAVLRDNSHYEQVQAVALGASTVLPSTASSAEICRAVAAALGADIASMPQTPPASAAEHVEQARLEFHNIFRAATCGEAFSRTEVDNATGSVVEAVGDGGIRRWLDIVWTYDNATYQHCMLVTGLAAAFATSLGLSAHDQERLVRGALLHDLGKAKIPLPILNKPGRLEPAELTVMRTHPGIGHGILREQGGYEPEILEVVLRHHELLDGSGYPDGLSGSQIGDLVRLTTICDIYAALIERRPYKQPLPPTRAFEILQDMGSKLEAALVRAFMRVAESSAVPVAA